jgi:folate-binding protein YgfZ
MTTMMSSLDWPRLERLRHEAVIVTGAPGVFEITGPGALACIQGQLTNDIVKPGENSAVYGALLTPKGMIVVDLWAIRQPGGITLIAETMGHDAAVELFQHQLPPRLARMTDLTGERGVAWLFGDESIGHLRFAGIGPVEERAGGVTTGHAGGEPLTIVRTESWGPPFRAMLVGSTAAIEAAAGILVRAGVVRADESDRQAARILSGWPALGAEIDDKTLPQEVRFDDIQGVSYTKGCYTGQETVARLHFRGHANRGLMGLRWHGNEPLEGESVLTEAGKEVGSVRSVLALPDRLLGIAMVRREVEPGELVIAGGRSARTSILPFGPSHFEPEYLGSTGSSRP